MKRCFAPLSLISLLALVLTGAARQKEPLEEYAKRRAALLEEVNAPVVLFAHEEGMNRAPEATFWQEPNFYYLSGHNEGGAALLLVPQTEDARAAGLPRATLFLPPRDKARERWDGVRLGPHDPQAAEQTGFEAVKPRAALRAELERALGLFPQLYTLFPEPGPESERTHAGRWLAWLREVAPAADFHDAREALGRLRQVKSANELELLRRATRVTMQAHREVMQTVAPGVYEYQVAAALEHVFKSEGCERPGFSSIVGSGPNSTVLHYRENDRRMEAGELVVVDIGAECEGYTADITRTLPVNGTFTERQREIYEIVLAAQNAALEAVKPGMTLSRTGENSLYKIAYDYINTHGKDKNGEPLGQYFIHGLGHHIGLEVHDAGPRGRTLEPGMVVTIEPGVYIPEENLGVRIEDIVLVTEDGYEHWTRELPRAVEAIERAMTEKK